jgi:hypothetical protein
MNPFNELSIQVIKDFFFDEKLSQHKIKGDRDDAIREKADTAGHSKMSRLSHLGEVQQREKT